MQGIVTDENGAYVKAAIVKLFKEGDLTGEAGAEAVTYAVTDERGRFVIQELNPDEKYMIEIHVESPQQAAAKVPEGEAAAPEGCAPEPAAQSEKEPEPEARPEEKPEPAIINEKAPEPAAVSEKAPEPAIVSEQASEPTVISEKAPEPEASKEANEPEPASLEKPEPEVTAFDALEELEMEFDEDLEDDFLDGPFLFKDTVIIDSLGSGRRATAAAFQKSVSTRDLYENTEELKCKPYMTSNNLW